MSRHPTLEELRALILDELDGEWTTPTELVRHLNLAYGARIDNNAGWVRVALLLERAANDGVIELKTPGSGIRRFRRKVSR